MSLLISVPAMANFDEEEKLAEEDPADKILTVSAKCDEATGLASEFPCKNTDLIRRMDLRKAGVEANWGNDIWGWTDPLTKREYALMGMDTKTAFIDVTDPDNTVHVGDLKTHTYRSIWRDIKVYKNYAYIVSEAPRHGMQVFDLTQLRDVDESGPIKFESTAHYRRFGSAHNIFINEDTGYAYAVGSDTCDNGAQVVDIRKPLEPRFVTCLDKAIFEPAVEAGDNARHGQDYTHDIQCVVYHGPHEEYRGREICIASNADTLNIVDVTDKRNPTQIAAKYYEKNRLHSPRVAD